MRACVAGAGGGHPPKRAGPCPQVPPLCAGVGEQGPGPSGPGAAAGGGGLRMAGCAALQARHVLRGGRQRWGPRPDMAGSADGGDLAAHLPILAFSEYLGCQGPPGGAGPACDAEAVGCPVSILPLGSCGSSPRLRPQPSPSPGGPAARQRPAPGWAPGPWPEDERPVCSGPAGGRGGGHELSRAPPHSCVWFHLTGGENFSRNRLAGPSPVWRASETSIFPRLKQVFFLHFFQRIKFQTPFCFSSHMPSRQGLPRSQGWGPLAGPPEPPGKWSPD